MAAVGVCGWLVGVRERRRPAWSYCVRVGTGGRRKETRAEVKVARVPEVVVVGGA